MKPSIGKLEGGSALEIDVQRLLVTRMLVQADPGGGKSWALRRLLEQTAGRVQQIVLDIEGEFLTLREKFDYVICAPHGADAVATPQTAAILARRLRETRVSAIIDMYELKMHERKRFVRLFLEELIEAPKSMWHPALVLIDEAHMFAPERDEAESLSAVIDLTARGRKRGLCAVLATQRLSKLNKDAAAGLRNKLIGVTTLDLDVARAADELALKSKKAAMPVLRDLDPGDFYCFGPALSRDIVKVKVGPVQTTHPEPGAGAVTRPPEPSAKIKALLAKLTDLPQQAEAEIRTLSDFKSENSRLKRELTLAKQAAPKVPGAKVTRIEVPAVGKRALAGITRSISEFRKSASKIISTHRVLDDAIVAVDSRIGQILQTLDNLANSPKGDRAPEMAEESPNLPRHAVKAYTQSMDLWVSSSAVKDGDTAHKSGLPGPQQRILDAIAWMESIGISEPDQTAVAFLAGYTVGGGAFNNPRGSLRTANLIEYRGNRLTLTDAGRGMATSPGTPLNTEELQARVMNRLPGPERKILAALIETYPNAMRDHDLAERVGYKIGGAFNNPKGRLRGMGLITYPERRHARAADLLFLS